MDGVSVALDANLPTFICHFSLDTIFEVHGIGYVLLYKALTGHTHTHTKPK